MRWQCIVSQAGRGSAAVLHSPLIKSLLMGPEENYPALTNACPGCQGKLFCRRTNMLFGSEILIGINIRGAAHWLASQHSGGNKDCMSNDSPALKLQNMAELSWEGAYDIFSLLREHCDWLFTWKVGMISKRLRVQRRKRNGDKTAKT